MLPTAASSNFISQTDPGPGAGVNALPGKSAAQLRHAAGEFESILLGQWLQGAEDSFGSVPGSDEDRDAADDQMKNFGVQALAKAFTQAGGVGISSIMAKALAHSGSQKAEVPK